MNRMKTSLMIGYGMTYPICQNSARYLNEVSYNKQSA